MSKTVIRIAGLSLASALACGLATSANAQLVTHKDLTLAMAVTMAQTAIATCKTNGYNVSANVVGRGGEVIVAMRGDATGPHTLENSMKKAYTAKAQRRPSGEQIAKRQVDAHEQRQTVQEVRKQRQAPNFFRIHSRDQNLPVGELHQPGEIGLHKG